ncbi:MAG: hypothetical protein FJ405_08090 [Verrucomicrobia bacterium]|nr:hypothetical protein [Verrucomicrobiota bacterium]
MKSIRNHLLNRLLIGIAVIWTLAGVGLYFFLEHNLNARTDAELQSLLPASRFLTARSLALRPLAAPPAIRGVVLESFESPQGSLYFQLFDSDLRSMARSQSLGSNNLLNAVTPQGRHTAMNLRLATGERVRVMVARAPDPFRGAMRGERPPGLHQDEAILGRAAWVAIGKNLGEQNQTLRLLLGGLTIAGLLMMGTAAFVVRMNLQAGLKPLDAVTKQAASMDAYTLQTRFSIEGLPSELQPIVQHLNELVSRLERSFEREKRFSADLAHELRTPVAELRLMAESAVKWPGQVPVDVFQDLLSIAQRMEQTVDSLLLLARLEKDASELQLTAVDLRDLTSECWNPFSTCAQQRDLKLQTSTHTETQVETDARLLRRILSNLFDNAVEYAPAGSVVRCEIGLVEETGVLWALSNEAPQLQGVDLDRMFDRLWRHDVSRSSDSRSGLGLSIARACAEALGLQLSASWSSDGWLRLELRHPGA